jgi:hypothetical protein
MVLRKRGKGKGNDRASTNIIKHNNCEGREHKDMY